jgi:hypothetical protein
MHGDPTMMLLLKGIDHNNFTNENYSKKYADAKIIPPPRGGCVVDPKIIT